MTGGLARVYRACMAFMIDGADPVEEVVSEVERVYGVQLKVLRSTDGGSSAGGGDDIEIGGRGKQDRT